MRSTRSSGSKETSLGEPPPRGGPTRLVAILQSRTGGRGRDSRSSISPFFDGCHVMLTPDDQARDVQRGRLLDKNDLSSETAPAAEPVHEQCPRLLDPWPRKSGQQCLEVQRRDHFRDHTVDRGPGGMCSVSSWRFFVTGSMPAYARTRKLPLGHLSMVPRRAVPTTRDDQTCGTLVSRAGFRKLASGL